MTGNVVRAVPSQISPWTGPHALHRGVHINPSAGHTGTMAGGHHCCLPATTGASQPSTEMILTHSQILGYGVHRSHCSLSLTSPGSLKNHPPLSQLLAVRLWFSLSHWSRTRMFQSVMKNVWVLMEPYCPQGYQEIWVGMARMPSLFTRQECG